MYARIPNAPGYRACDDGTVETSWQPRGRGRGKPVDWRHGENWRKLKPDADSRGRKRYTLAIGGKYKKFRGSRLILLAFIGPCPDGMECCHEDGDETNDRLDNLRWGSRESNCEDKRRHGTLPLGERAGRNKLTEKQVLEIIASGRPLKPLAVKYGVSEATVSHVLRGKTWKYLREKEAARG